MSGAVVEVPAVPPLSRSYRRGAALSVRAMAKRPTVSADDLPAETLVTSGVRPDADHLTAYQHCVGESAADELPAGFVHVLTFPLATALMVRPGYPLPVLGMVHLANRVTQLRPVRLGEDLTTRVHAEDLRAHRKGAAVDIVATVETGGDEVWRGVSTYLAKGVRLAGSTADDAPHPRFDPPPQTGVWRLDAAAGRRYADVSGDRNPIHTSRLAARAFGFPRPLVHGMYTAARALADVGRVRGDAFIWHVEFARPVLLPTTVAVGIAADDGGHRYAGWSPRSGKPHLTGSVRPLEAGAGGER